MATDPLKLDLDGKQRFKSLEIPLAALSDYASVNRGDIPFADTKQFPQYADWSSAGLAALEAGRKYRKMPTLVRGEDLEKISSDPFDIAWKAYILNAYVELFRSNNMHIPIGCLGEVLPRIQLDGLRGLRETFYQFSRVNRLEEPFGFASPDHISSVIANVQKGIEQAQSDNTVNILEGLTLPFSCSDTTSLGIYAQTALAKAMLAPEAPSLNPIPSNLPYTNPNNPSLPLPPGAMPPQPPRFARVSDPYLGAPSNASENNAGNVSISMDEGRNLILDGAVTVYTLRAARVPMVKYTMSFETKNEKLVQLFGDVIVKAEHPKAYAVYGVAEGRMDPNVFVQSTDQKNIFEKGKEVVLKKMKMGIRPDILKAAEGAGEAAKGEVTGYTVTEIVKGWSLQGLTIKNALGLLLGAGGVADIIYATYNKIAHGKFQGITRHFAQRGIGEDEAALLGTGAVAVVDLGITAGLVTFGVVSTAAAAGFFVATAVAAVGLPLGAALYYMHRSADRDLEESLNRIRNPSYSKPTPLEAPSPDVEALDDLPICWVNRSPDPGYLESGKT